MLKGKHVILGVTGSIAAYKAAVLAREFVKKGAQVQVLMTKNAAKFITPLTFESLTKTKCLVDTFDRGSDEVRVEHVALADWADCVVVAPADANSIARFAHGIADDMLSTTMLACDCEKFIAPSMNTKMFENPATQYNLAVLRTRNCRILEPEEGKLACGTSGKGRMEEPEKIVDWVDHIIGRGEEWKGKKVLVTAGPTREALDPVRFLSNASTGKMGCALAREAVQRGAEVTLICGPIELSTPDYLYRIDVTTAAEMADAVMKEADEQDIFLCAAAVADYRPKVTAEEKIKKQEGDTALTLTRTQDILGTLGARRRPGQILCGFSMETENLLENSRRKLEQKHLDLIAANNVKEEGAGFASDTNRVTLITKDSEEELPLLTKDETASRILDKISEIM